MRPLIAILAAWATTLACAAPFERLADVNRTFILSQQGGSPTPIGDRWVLTLCDYGSICHPWSTDGTDDNTVLLSALITWSDYVSFGGRIYFFASDNFTAGRLMQTDGTPSGTTMTDVILPPNASGLMVAGPYMYFTDGPSALWRTDGTAAGTAKVVELSDLRELTSLGSLLLFTAADAAHGRELWRSDGTPAGTTIVRDITPGAVDGLGTQASLAKVGNKLLFWAYARGPDYSWWSTDGTEAGTVPLSPSATAYTPYTRSFAVGALGYAFVPDPAAPSGGIYRLLRTDGSPAGTSTVRSNLPGMLDAIVGGDAIYFSAFNGQYSLWRTDGTSAGTAQISSNVGPFPVGPMVWYSGALYTTNLDTQATGPHISRVDPSPPFAISNTGLSGAPWGVLGDKLVSSDHVAFLSDGTAGGQRAWRSPASYDRIPSDCRGSPATLGAMVLFVADDGEHGCELWRTDGTPAGTVLVKDLLPGPADGFDINYGNPRFVVAGALAYFTAGPTVWRTDGTAAGTIKLANNPVSQPVAAGPRVFFFTDGFNTRLWQSDGTPGGTSVLRTFLYGEPEQPFLGLAAVQDKAFFLVRNGPDIGVYRIDATRGGMSQVGSRPGYSAALYATDSRLYATWSDSIVNRLDLLDMQSGAASTVFQGPANDSQLTIIGSYRDALVFTAWGQAQGTYSARGSSLQQLAASGAAPGETATDGLYFTANDGALRKTDGTSAGTIVVAQGLSIDRMTAIGDSIFFLSYDDVSGGGIWTANRNGARRLGGSVPGPGTIELGVGLHPYAATGGRLVFHAGPSALLLEPYAYDLDSTPDSFQFTDATGVLSSATVTSNPARVTGFDLAQVATASNGELCVSSTNSCSCDRTPYAGSALVSAGDWICLRHTSASAALASITTTVSIGAAAATFTSTTGAARLLQVSRAGSGSGRVASADHAIDCGAVCSAGIPPGASVTLVAIASPGSHFSGWSGACSGRGTCTIRMSAPAAVAAEFDVGASVLGADLNGDGHADLLWHHPSAGDGAWLMAGANASSAAGIAPPAAGATIRLEGDFDGDGHTDLLWRTPQGAYYVTLMNGLAVSASAKVLDAGSGWEVAGVADFDGDGRADLAWRGPGGAFGLWLMNGTAVSAYGALAPPSPAASAILFGDFDGDGKADIVWRGTDGSVVVSLMDGLASRASARLLGPGTAWAPVMTGDFDGDGKVDLIWRHTDGSYGLWLMNGVAAPTPFVLAGAGTGWTLAFTRDLNGDGKSDLIWHHADGSWAGTLMNGGSSVAIKVWMAGNAGWSIVAADDLDGDGKCDLVWRSSSGQYAVWLMNGLNASFYSYILDGGTGWELVP